MDTEKKGQGMTASFVGGEDGVLVEQEGGLVCV